jgi:hypothetical protein
MIAVTGEDVTALASMPILANKQTVNTEKQLNNLLILFIGVDSL